MEEFGWTESSEQPHPGVDPAWRQTGRTGAPASRVAHREAAQFGGLSLPVQATVQ